MTYLGEFFTGEEFFSDSTKRKSCEELSIKDIEKVYDLIFRALHDLPLQLKMQLRVSWCIAQKTCFLTKLTLKNSFVEPESRVPYAISVCFARSSALSIGDTILSTVKKAARLAV